MTDQTTAARHETDGAPAAPFGTLYHVTFKSSRYDGADWRVASHSYSAGLRSLDHALERSGRSLDGKVVSIHAKLWRDRGPQIIRNVLQDYQRVRRAVLFTPTTDLENIAGKVRLLAELLNLPDPHEGVPLPGTRDAEAYGDAALALTKLHEDLINAARAGAKRPKDRKHGKR